MPHLVQMEKKLSKKGLVVVAPEVQGSSEEDIKKLVDKNKIGYTVTKSISGPSLGNGIPRTAVFDVSGKLIYVGHPMADETEKAIKKALKDATPDGDSGSSSTGLAPRKADLVANRGWTNSEGKAIEAALVEVVGTTGHFKFPNGRKFEYDVTKLSAADQELIKKAATPEAASE
ncbi:MAG: TlpA family protein disulfide reductase [Verrucomicrobiales bacterium]